MLEKLNDLHRQVWEAAQVEQDRLLKADLLETANALTEAFMAMERHERRVVALSERG